MLTSFYFQQKRQVNQSEEYVCVLSLSLQQLRRKWTQGDLGFQAELGSLEFNGVTVCTCVLSHVQLFVTPWTVACQAPLSMGFSRQEYWSGLPFPSPGDLPNPGIKPESPALAGEFFATVSRGKFMLGLL